MLAIVQNKLGSDEGFKRFVLKPMGKLGSDEGFKRFVLKPKIFLSGFDADFIAIDLSLNQDWATADKAVFGIGLRFGGVDQ